MAIQIIREVTADVVKRGSTRTIYAKQNDFNSRFLKVRIQADGKDIVVKSTSTVILNVERSDNAKDMFYGAVNEDGTVTTPLTSWMLALEGTLVCDISIVSINPSEAKLTTMKFNIVVEAAVNGDESIVDTEEYSVIVDLLDRAEEAMKASNAANRAEAAANIAVTEASKAAASVTQAQEIVDSVATTLNNYDSRITRNTKEIINLKAGLPDEDFVEDDSVAYIKDVPEKALPYAEISEIGGMSRKCANLIPFPYSFGNSYTTWGVTFTANSDGSVTLNGTFGASTVINVDLISHSNAITLPAGSYYISGIPLNGNPVGFVGSIYSLNGTLEKYIYSNAFTIAEPKKFGLLMQLAVGSSFSKNTFYPMLNEGSTALPYESYYKGLRDVKVTAVESIGVNLFSGEISAKTAPTTYSFANGTLKFKRNGGAIQGGIWSKEKYKSGTYTISFSLSGMGSTNFVLATTATASATNTGTWVKTWFANGQATYTFTLTEDRYIGVFTDGDGIEITAANIMLNEGDTPLPYTPYFKNTLEIPEAVQALDGYGQGVSKEYHNKIVLDPAEGVKKYVKSVGVVDMGTLDWVLNNANVFQSSTLGKIGNYLICSKYEYAGIVAGNADAYSKGDKTISIYGIDKRIYVRDDSFTDAATFKASMQGVMLVYVLATPIETDVSDYFGEDNLIGVEGGGTVAMVNEHCFDAPSAITYQIKSEVSV